MSRYIERFSAYVSHCESCLGPWKTSLLVGVIFWFVSLFLAAPSVRVLATNTDNSRLQVFAKQCQNPLEHDLTIPWSNQPEFEEKFLAYRIFVPTIAWLLFLRGYAGVLIIVLSNILTVSLIHRWLRRNSISPQLSLIVTFLLATSVVTQASNVYVGYVDAMTNCLLMALLFAHSPAWWSAITFAGLLNDERFVIGLPAVLLALTVGKQVSELVRFVAPRLVYVAVGATVAIAVRHAITVGWLGEPLTAQIFSQMGFFLYGSWSSRFVAWAFSFKALWVLPILALRRSRDPIMVAALLYLIACLAISASVADIWRSTAQCFPVFLLFALRFEAVLETKARLLGFLCLAQVLLPTLNIIDKGIMWVRPLPISVFEWCVGASVLGLVRNL